MSRKQLAAGLAAAAVIAVPATYVATADASPKVHTITGTSKSLGGGEVGKNNFAAVDAITNSKGKPIGFDAINGIVNPKTGASKLVGVLSLKGGLIYYTLSQGADNVGTGKITGGTGTYKGARGTVSSKVTSTDEGTTIATVKWHK